MTAFEARGFVASVGTLVSVTALLACGHREPSPTPRPARGAKGTVVLTPAAIESTSAAFAGDGVRIVLATEAEVLKSNRLAELAARKIGVMDSQHPPDAKVRKLQESVTVTPRGDSLVLEVSVSADERDKAVSYCNALIEAYVDSRLEAKVMAIEVRLKALAENVDRLTSAKQEPTTAKELERAISEMAAAELERKTVPRDATVLDWCVAFGWDQGRVPPSSSTSLEDGREPRSPGGRPARNAELEKAGLVIF